MTIVIINSGSANLRSIFKAAEMVSLPVIISDRPKDITSARAIIFPGVGSFNHAAMLIKENMLAEPLRQIIAEQKPFLGICLGMQLLFSQSEEAVTVEKPVEGLNVIPGTVKRLPDQLPVPHVGWNIVKPVHNHPLFEGFCEDAYFYFTHSYYVKPDNDDHTLALTDYSLPFTSAVANNNLYGVQFHPEKSGSAGLRLLSNFGKIIADQC